MEPSVNGVDINLGTIVHVEIADPPIPSATFFDLTADISVKVPIITLEDGVNVGAQLENLPPDAINATITSGDPIGPVTDAMIEEFIHEKLRNDPAVQMQYNDIPISFTVFSMKANFEMYDDESDPTKTAKVSFPSGSQVKIDIPCYLYFYDITGEFAGQSLASPMGILGTVQMISEYSITGNKVVAKLSEATVTLENLTPAPGQEGINYSTNVTLSNFVSNGILESTIKTQFSALAESELQQIGDLEQDVPSQETIEKFIEDEVRKELASRKQILIWEPVPPDGVDVTINDVTIKSLTQGLAIAINKFNGSNANAITFFVPAGRDFATAISEKKVLEEINKAVNEEFGSLPTTLDEKVKGKTVKLNSLDISLKTGAIDIEGDVTVVDAIAGSIDVDADFDADAGLKWIDGPEGGQIIEPFVIGEPDVDLSLLAWILSFLIGFLFGIVGIIIVAVVMTLAENLAESIGASIIKDDVSDQLTGIGAWPNSLTDIGDIQARFENPISIDPHSILFSGNMLITSMHALTSEDFANSNGPYSVVGNQAVSFIGGAEKMTSKTLWDFDNGKSTITRNPNHSYGKSGLYIAKFKVSVEEDGGVTTRHFAEVNVKNVAPQVFMPEDITVDEGEQFTIEVTFIDLNWLDKHTASVTWGDDSPPEILEVSETNEEPQAQGKVTACHTYCDNGNFEIKVTIRDDVGGIGIGIMYANVNNVPPLVMLPELMYSLKNQCVRLDGLFEDEGWCDTHTGFWKMGDCTVRNAYIEQTNDPPKAQGIASVAHSYDCCGPKEITLTITDDDGGVGEASMIVHVNELLNADMEGGFHKLVFDDLDSELTVANHWIPYASTVETTDKRAQAAGFQLDFNFEIGIVSDGRRAQRIILNGAVQTGLMQQIAVNVGWEYEFTGMFQIATTTQAQGCIGIDPLGGTDPDSSSIVWRQLEKGTEWQNITVRAIAERDNITVFFGALQRTAITSELYLDQAALHQIQPHCIESEECEEICVDFEEMTGDTVITEPFEYDTLRFIPPKIGLFITQIGDPQGQNKLGFHPAGVKIEFPHSITTVRITIANYAGRTIQLATMYDDEILSSFDEIIYNETKTLQIEDESFNGLFVRGGDSESAIVKICYCYNEE
ncbi:PKD domain-containing protein [Mangrovivirga cuniculi]|uniref:PKD domain-containing protein n=1 Tax=Mangrovivirga cuniculi TaxID=2715131 RepID=A0A4D7JIF8_9BACT|nr:PKD domain-containing protein [Mangrovivirga cuniculi]QCK15779.1 hypothetical protein DCC35_14005 [Mangrovivirga cuniculi]